MGKDFDLLVFIGRFQPFHNGHKHIIEEALKRANKVVVLIGSSYKARSPKNPFTYQERSAMILNTFPGANLLVAPVTDMMWSDNAWANAVKGEVQKVLDKINPSPTVTLHGTNDVKVGLIGYSKDSSSYYLKMFPEWGSVNIETQHGTINSTDLRHDYITSAPRIPGEHLVPEFVREFLTTFMLREEFKWLLNERRKYDDERLAWGSCPYQPVAYCVDALVTLKERHDYVLLIQRKNAPGKGLLALPGGHVEPGESHEEARFRELEEEAGLTADDIDILDEYDCPLEELIADHPHRSERFVRPVSIVQHMTVDDEKVRLTAGDDAATAQWYRLGELTTSMFFEDHATLITRITGHRITEA